MNARGRYIDTNICIDVYLHIYKHIHTFIKTLWAAFTVKMASTRPSMEPLLPWLWVMAVTGTSHTASEKFPQEDPRWQWPPQRTRDPVLCYARPGCPLLLGSCVFDSTQWRWFLSLTTYIPELQALPFHALASWISCLSLWVPLPSSIKWRWCWANETLGSFVCPSKKGVPPILLPLE